MSVSEAASLFRVTKKHISSFDREDPFNNQMVRGFVCRKKGKMGGSLLITHVNDVEVEHQLIYGTPKLAYPYQPNSTDYIKFPDARWFHFADKWNGMNVLFYKYKDADGKTFVTAKSKGTPFLGDGEYGNFLSLTKQAMEKVPNFLEDLGDSEVQSVSYELCGYLEPHLVQYDFDIALVPLFKIYNDGKIRPFGVKAYQDFHSSEDLEQLCRSVQEHSLKANQAFRSRLSLPLKYEYEHFFTEGKVLYLCDIYGNLIDCTMYKCKPADVEEVHWSSFNDSMRERVQEAVQKIHLNEEGVSADTLQQELDMGPKEWGKFGRQVMKFVESMESK